MDGLSGVRLVPEGEPVERCSSSVAHKMRPRGPHGEMCVGLRRFAEFEHAADDRLDA